MSIFYYTPDGTAADVTSAIGHPQALGTNSVSGIPMSHPSFPLYGGVVQGQQSIPNTYNVQLLQRSAIGHLLGTNSGSGVITSHPPFLLPGGFVQGQQANSNIHIHYNFSGLSELYGNGSEISNPNTNIYNNISNFNNEGFGNGFESSNPYTPIPDPEFRHGFHSTLPVDHTIDNGTSAPPTIGDRYDLYQFSQAVGEDYQHGFQATEPLGVHTLDDNAGITMPPISGHTSGPQQFSPQGVEVQDAGAEESIVDDRHGFHSTDLLGVHTLDDGADISPPTIGHTHGLQQYSPQGVEVQDLPGAEFIADDRHGFHSTDLLGVHTLDYGADISSLPTIGHTHGLQQYSPQGVEVQDLPGAEFIANDLLPTANGHAGSGAIVAPHGTTSTPCASVFTTTGGQQDVGIHPSQTYFNLPPANVADIEQRGGPVSLGNDVTGVDSTAAERHWISATQYLANIYKAQAEDGDSLEVDRNRDRITNDAGNLGTPGHICASAPSPRPHRHDTRKNGKPAVHHSAPKRKRSCSAIDAQACRGALKSLSKRRRLKPKCRAFAGEQIDMLLSPCMPPVEKLLAKPHRREKRRRSVWACSADGCSLTFKEEADSMLHILTHVGGFACFGCNHNFGTRLEILAKHVKKAQRLDKMSPCVKRSPLVRKRKSGKGDWKGTTWDKVQFLENPTLIGFDGGVHRVKVKWV